MAAPAVADDAGWTLGALADLPAPRAVTGLGVLSEATAAPTSRRWLVLTPPPAFTAAAAAADRHPWDLAHEILAGTGSGAAAGLAALGGPDSPIVAVAVEPEVYFENRRLSAARDKADDRECSDRCTTSTTGSELTLCCGPSKHWPAPDRFAWHLEGAYSGLSAARSAAADAFSDPARRVRIAHLDTGYDDGHVTTPPHLSVTDSVDFTAGDEPRPGGVDPLTGGVGKNPGHGTGTLGILAGARVQAAHGGGAFDDFLGGAPLADVREFRISASVVHLTPVEMATAILEAVEQEVDVVSISMGGLPSGFLRDAVNHAYDSGTAIFAASGDFIQPPLLPLRSPRSVVYPARFGRAVAVCGVTADHETYAKAARRFSWLRGRVSSWSLRGSYGPRSAMETALAAYAPNVTWARHGGGENSNLLDLDGAGTSSSTPQAAAAAALWLQHRRPELDDVWRTWRKTEAVYRALFDSAEKRVPNRGYSRKYFGQGILRADAALGLPVATDLERRKPSTVGLGWLELIGSIGPFAEEPGRGALHNEMLRTEIAQLVHRSVKLQRILGDQGVEEAPLDESRRRRFLRALLDDSAASGTLRQALETVLN